MSLENYECPRCEARFCFDHEEHLLFFEPDIGSSGLYAVSPDAGRSERQEAEQALARMEAKLLKEWMQDAEERGLAPMDWGEVQFFEDNMGHSGPGWYFCESCYTQVSGDEKPDKNRNRAVDRSENGCFVATVVYGDYDHPDVMRLRAFRDVVLQPTTMGRVSVALYYRYGPHLAESIKGYPMLKSGVRWTLKQVVNRWLR